MTDTTDLITWLRERLDEDERLAHVAASGRRWEAITDGATSPMVRVGDGDLDDDGPEWLRNVNYAMWGCDDEDDGCPDFARGWVAEARHIARHDPTRVLREVEAKRRILDEAGWAKQNAEMEGGDPRAAALYQGAWITYQAVLRWLSQVYADRPGYREQWAP
jgi:hypothetical protein